MEAVYPGLNPSDQHGHATNLAFNCLCTPTDYRHIDPHPYVLFLDHDIFPFKYSNVFDVIKNHTFYSRKWVTQSGVVQIWPGFFGINNNRHSEPVSFLPINGVGDTGIQWAKVLSILPSEEIYFVEEKHIFMHQNFEPQYYEEFDNCFMHLIKASNWNKVTPTLHEARVKAFMNKLEELQKND